MEETERVIDEVSSLLAKRAAAFVLKFEEEDIILEPIPGTNLSLLVGWKSEL